jgi:hypothetical protein
MPIRELVKVSEFSPEQTEALVSAFDSTLAEKSLDRRHPTARLIAKKMIEILKAGEGDPEKLRASTLAALGLGPA